MKFRSLLYLISSVLTYFSFSASGQNTFVYKFEGLTSSGSVYQLVDDNTMVFLGSLNAGEPAFADIAIGPSGDLYGLSQIGSIRLINLDEGTTTEVGAFSAITVHTAFTCDSQSNFYSLDFFDNLVSYNTVTQQETTIMAVGEITPGDLTFYNGDLVFPSGEGVLKTIDLDTQEIEAIYTLTPEMITLNDVWGIANSFHQCGSEELIVSNFSNQLFRINVEENSFVELTPEYDTDMGGVIYGLTSSDDLLASDCDGFVGVESLTNSPTGFFYPNPAKNILHVPNHSFLASLEVYDINGRLIRTLNKVEQQMSLDDYSSGFYLLKIRGINGEVREQKLIIAK